MLEINDLCRERGWTRARLILQLREAARAQRKTLPADDSLRRMIRGWANGSIGLSDFYADLFTEVFGVPVGGRPSIAPGPAASAVSDEEVPEELGDRLARAASVDLELVALFEGQTHSLRTLDRRLGAAQSLAQTEAHVTQMRTLLAYSMPGMARSALAAAVAEGAALAGWQALDLGDTAKAWRHHETAKAAALESGNGAVLAHVTAQQAYALLDLDRADQALTLVSHARSSAGNRIPVLLQSWLCAAEAEALAACGRAAPAQHRMEEAACLLPTDASDPDLPYLFLDTTHLARWRGNCLARLGAAEAIDDLIRAVAGLDPTFIRAAAGLHCDLATAYAARGLHEDARREARLAAELAQRMSSVRQRRRINRLLSSGGTERPHR